MSGYKETQRDIQHLLALINAKRVVGPLPALGMALIDVDEQSVSYAEIADPRTSFMQSYVAEGLEDGDHRMAIPVTRCGTEESESEIDASNLPPMLVEITNSEGHVERYIEIPDPRTVFCQLFNATQLNLASECARPVARRRHVNLPTVHAAAATDLAATRSQNANRPKNKRRRTMAKGGVK